jgi:hypothetical protein
MQMPNKKGWLAIFFIIFCLTVPFGITYYVSTPASRERFEQFRERGTNALVRSQVSVKQLLLVKNDRVTFKNTSLIFKGLENGQLMLDLYLLELDPGYAYPQRFSRKTNGNAVRLGDVTYCVISANNTALTLKIIGTMGTD